MGARGETMLIMDSFSQLSYHLLLSEECDKIAIEPPFVLLYSLDY